MPPSARSSEPRSPKSPTASSTSVAEHARGLVAVADERAHRHAALAQRAHDVRADVAGRAGHQMLSSDSSLARRDVDVETEDVGRVVAVLERDEPGEAVAVGGPHAGGPSSDRKVAYWRPALCGRSASQPSRTHARWRSPSGSPGGQTAISRSSKPTSRAPTAVASGGTRLAAPPIAQPLSSDNGEVMRLDQADDQVDHRVGQLGQAVRAPVRVGAGRGAAVEQRLQRAVRDRADQRRRSACRSPAAARSRARPRRCRRTTTSSSPNTGVP